MPPKKMSQGDRNLSSDSMINPRVIIRPLKANCFDDSRYSFTTLPPTASLYNRPETSDVKLKVGDTIYYAHRLILSAASEVFQSMFCDKWAENDMSEIELQEDRDCIKVFGSFLYFLYSGSIMRNEDNVVALFMLADKYDVELLYRECVRVIEDGLKVYTVTRVKHEQIMAKGRRVRQGSGQGSRQGSGQGTQSSACSSQTLASTSTAVYKSSSSSSSSSYSSNSSSDSEEESASPPEPPTTRYLVGMETFPLTVVMKILRLCQNERIIKAARYNLEARFCKHIVHANYGVWNDIDQDLLVELLSDMYFYCKEFVLFNAARSWLGYRPDRQDEDTLAAVLASIRYPLLTAEELYEVSTDPFVEKCQVAQDLIQNAMRYKLFKNCSKAVGKEKWAGAQYEPRISKDM